VPTLALELKLHGVDPIRLGVDRVSASEEACLRPLPRIIAASGPFAGAILRSDGSLHMCLDPALVAARAWGCASER
jgi:chemotaxis protein histidine kinase CheA